MKKVISFAVAVVLIATFVFAAASCKKDDKTDGKYNFSAEVKSYELDVYNGDEAFQTLEYPSDRRLEVDLDFAKKHIELVDLNFDGFEDICLAIKKDGNSIKYFCWLFDGEAEKFEYSEELSALTTISVNAEKKQIISSVTESGKTGYTCYEWENGTLKKVDTLESEDNRVPSDVSEAVKNNTLGEKENTVEPPKTASTEKNNESTTKKTSNTDSSKTETTTKNNTSSSTATQKTTEKTEDTTKSDNTAATGSVQLATGDFDDGWF